MLRCPDCQQTIGGDDFNVATDIALCRRCGKRHQYSKLAAMEAAPGFDAGELPSGLKLSCDGHGETLRYRIFTSTAWVVLIFALIWNGMVSRLVSGVTSKPFSPQMLLAIPFVAVGIIMAIAALLQLFGHVEVRCRDEELEIFTGIGPIGRTRRVRFAEISMIDVTQSYNGNNSRINGVAIRLSGGKLLWLLRGAKTERQEYAVNFLRTLTARARR